MDEPAALELRTKRLRVWLPNPEHAALVQRFHLENADHLNAWSPPHPPEFDTVDYWRKRLARDQRDYIEDRSLRLVVTRLDSKPTRIIGVCSFTDFVRGPLQTCQLGYALAADQQGQGFITEALRRAIDHVFTELHLHRVEATYSPLNHKSGAVLERLGFTVEGYLRKFLYVNGAWRDHLLASLLNPRPEPPLINPL